MSRSMIRADRFSFRYPGAEQAVLHDVRLDIPERDFVAIIGSNGSGKSTLCKAFNGLIPHFYNGDADGELFVQGHSTLTQSVDQLATRIGYVYQDFENQLVRPTVWDEITFAPINYGMADYRERAEHALALLGLGDLRHQFIWQLSGGQKHLVALAGVLTLNPDILIIDEPAAQLDPQHAVMIYDKLKQLNEQLGKTIIVIEHHTELIASYCKHVLLVDQGQVRWYKPVKEALNEWETLAALHILPPQVTQVFHYSQERLRTSELLPITLEEALHAWPSVQEGLDTKIESRPTEAKSRHGEPTVQLAGICHTYKTVDKQQATALQDIDLTFHEGDRAVIVGNNGAGKSTLLKLIAGMNKPSQGAITLLGRPARKLSPEHIADVATYIYQNPEEMFIADNIRADIEYFLKARKVAEYASFVDELIALFRLKALEGRDARLLSGGQQRRASLAVGLAMKPQIMLLDEPTSSLDVSSRKELVQMLDLLRDRVRTVIIATHDMQLVAEWANRVIVMHQGHVAADTTSRELFSNSELMDRCGLKLPQVTELSLRCGHAQPALSVEEFIQRYEMERDSLEVG